MKSYKEFINENYHSTNLGKDLPEFKFAIDMRNSTAEEKDSILKELKKYFNINDKDDDSMLPLLSEDPWAWVFEIKKEWKPKIGKTLLCDFVTTPNWGAGWDYMEYIITPKEFLNLGIEDVKDYIETKSDADKYNL